MKNRISSLLGRVFANKIGLPLAIVAAIACLFLITPAAVCLDNWQFWLQVDNYGTVYLGDATTTIGSVLGTTTYNSSGACRFNFPALQQPTNAYLYVATASDQSGAQGFIGKFLNQTTGATALTGDQVWKVFPAGK